MWGQMVYVCVCLYVCELETSKISLLHASNPPPPPGIFSDHICMPAFPVNHASWQFGPSLYAITL